MVGVIDNADWGHATFGGETVSQTDILVKYTYIGDANVDGQVDSDDFNQFLFGFDANNGAPKTWLNGDFDFDNDVDSDDFNFFLLGFDAYNASGGQAP
jgi:hypothetical protein